MTAVDTQLSAEEIKRYSRHLILPEVTLEGQKKLKAASVLVIGSGGLGAPVSMYLAAAGIGRIGMVDFDVVDESNLQRQILFDTKDVGTHKLTAARDRLTAINPNVQIDTYEARFSSDNALDIIKPYDVVIDGTDNFPTRYCTNDACVMLGKPNVYGSIFRFEGQATVFDPREGADGKPKGPCYRCLYPEPPPPGMAPSCAEGGVLGILPGVVGCIQATEALKLILGIGKPLTNRLVRYNALDMQFREFKLRRDPDCPMCGDNPSITELIDYEQFCGIRGEESDTVIRDTEIPEIDVNQLKALIDGDEAFELIDVREPHEYDIASIPKAKLVPLRQIPAKLSQFDSTKKYIVHCKMGGRSAQAVELMREAGLDATNVAGGILAWSAKIDPSVPSY
ncbi:molybdopterin-synthase adenylyltransferase MoeB [Phycisphaerales bacterium AB-hyl4]|uniref:Molybdopterin-synthase adenylyltransferase MoeB n=1 Tax=Natronomicrosphaera hydrolytica TaxID=3242702 RepID=A0ABV4U3A5_9BACT